MKIEKESTSKKLLIKDNNGELVEWINVGEAWRLNKIATSEEYDNGISGSCDHLDIIENSFVIIEDQRNNNKEIEAIYVEVGWKCVNCAETVWYNRSWYVKNDTYLNNTISIGYDNVVITPKGVKCDI